MKTKINASELMEQVQKSQSETPEVVKAQLECEIMEETEEMEARGLNPYDVKNINKKVKGVYSYCLITVARTPREKYKLEQYAVETINGSKTRYYMEATDEQGQPVKLTKEAQTEIVEACTTLYWQDSSNIVRRMPSFLIKPDQTRLQELWDKHNLWPLFVFITNRPKPKQKQEKPKKPTEIKRIGSTFAGAVRTALIEIKDKDKDNNETVTRVNIPQDVKRLLLILATRIKPTEYNAARDPFESWESVTFKRTDLRAMAREMYGESGPEQNKNVVKAILQTAMTNVVNIRFVDTPSKGNEPKRGEVTITPGTFIRNIKAPSHMENGQRVIDSDPDYISITLNNIFGYWLNRFYGSADVHSLIDRSRGKNGAEYMAIRLWGVDIAPQVAAATKKAVYSAIFELNELPGWQQSGPKNRRNMRERATAAAAEAAKDMGATYTGTATKQGNGGKTITGLMFKWPKSLQKIEAKKEENEA